MPSCYYYDEQRNRCNCYINENLNELLAENARLRSELESVGTAAYLYGRNDLKIENAKLRDELANAPKCEACEAMLDCDECLRADGSHKERRRLSAENAKLRELVKSVLVLRHDSVFKWLDASMVEVCGTSFTAQARELGVEADE